MKHHRPRSEGGTESYAYDGSSERVLKAGPGGTTEYVYDAFGQLAAEYGPTANTLSQEYIRFNAQVLAIENAGTAPCRTCYLTYDYLGNVRIVTDQNANVISRHDYLPFGEEIPGGTVGSSGHFGVQDSVSQRFTGQMRDAESGEDFFNARYFTGALGRFNSPDPGNAGADPTNPQSWNGYAYVGNNAMNATDPDGLSTLIFDGASQTLTVIPSDPNAQQGKFCAANNVDSRNTIGKLVDDTYSFLSTTQPYTQHSAADAAENGAFGPGGIFTLRAFVGADGRTHIGVGIHAGRANAKDRAGRSGYRYATNGCIRTTDPAITYITNLAAHDPLTTLTVVNNRKPPAKPTGTASSTIRYGSLTSNGLGWSSFDLLQLLFQGGSSDAFLPTTWFEGGGTPDVSSKITYDMNNQ